MPLNHEENEESEVPSKVGRNWYKLMTDNAAALHLTASEVPTGRTKHLDVRCRFVWETIKRGIMKVVYVFTGENHADMFTKPCAQKKLRILVKEMKEKQRKKD